MITKFKLLFLFIPALLYAQTKFVGEDVAGISGYIYNEFAEPLAGAEITIDNNGQYDISDANGFFELVPLVQGTYSIKVKHISYKPDVIENIKVNSGTITAADTVFLKTYIYNTENVIITATRNARKIYEVANALNLVDKLEIERRNSKTSAEALREEPGVFVQKTNHGGGSAIIRGLKSNRILILVDGVRLNNSTYRLGNHQYLTTVDPNLLERIEVIRGPGSVLYGSDALGGTINLISQMPDLTDNLNFNSTFSTRYATADDEKTSALRISLTSEKWAWQGGLRYSDFGDLKQGQYNIKKILLSDQVESIQKPTAYTAYDIDNKLFYKPGINQQWIFAYQLSRQEDVPRYDKYAYDNEFKWLYDPQERDLIYLSYQNRLHFSWLNSIQATVSWQRQLEGRKQQTQESSPLLVEQDEVKTSGLNLQFNSITGKHIFTYGFDFYSDDINSTASEKDLTTGAEDSGLRGRYPDEAEYNSYGIYFQDEWHPLSNLYLTMGLRYSAFNAKYKESNPDVGKVDLNFRSLNGSVNLNYTITEGYRLTMGISQGFRAPNLSDLGKLGESKGNIFEIPNPDLKPEESLNYELGFKTNLPNWNAEISGFYSDISEIIGNAQDLLKGSPTFIKNSDTLDIRSKQNIGDAYITGIEGSFSINLKDNFLFRTNLSYIYGKNITANEPVGGIPPFFGLAGLRFYSPNYEAEIYTRFAGNQDRLSADDLEDPRIPNSGTPGWFTLNLRGHYHFNDTIQLNAGIENIFDVLYREHGSGINSPGRNFIIGLKITI